ncbi:MAG: hypothetical protein LJF30_06645 [Acidobacteria bacterium]|nr:hypothetical protein [Acidobacteriota bacterium]
MTTADIPAFLRIRQRFPRPRVEDLAGLVRDELESLLPAASVVPGAEIGVTVGSRGIRGIATIARAAVDVLRERGARPFVIPAMGSHGGATALAQRRLIAHYGVTAETMGCPVRAEMDTRSLGRTSTGIEVRISEVAWRSDGILLVNRIKPHTDYKGPIESGLTKICAIGLGKYDGAREIHRHRFADGLGPAIRSVAETLLATGKILGGLAILENAYHETARVVGVPVGSLFPAEERLLDEARGLMGRLPLDEIDVLVCDRLGKNISGTGLDTNVTGRCVYGYTPGTAWCEGMPSIRRIVVMDVSDESDGNAVGMGQVDLVPERFARRVDHRVTTLNALTSCAPTAAKMPVVLPDDREAVLAAIRTSPIRTEGPRVVYVRDTLELEHVLVSEACRPLVDGRDDIEIVSGPEALHFDAQGRLQSPF